jgi:hypothetical protein
VDAKATRLWVRSSKANEAIVPAKAQPVVTENPAELHDSGPADAQHHIRTVKCVWNGLRRLCQRSQGVRPACIFACTGTIAIRGGPFHS